MTKFSGLAVAVMLVCPTAAFPATYNVTMGGSAGTFDAPVGGGAITAFSILLGSTLFDTLTLGSSAPVYNPILNTLNGLFDVEFRGAGQGTGIVTNSVGTAECPVGQCVLQLFDTIAGTQQPEYAALNTVTFQNIAFGNYAIDPVPVTPPIPLPAPAILLAAACGGLAFAVRRKALPAC